MKKKYIFALLLKTGVKVRLVLVEADSLEEALSETKKEIKDFDLSLYLKHTL